MKQRFAPVLALALALALLLAACGGSSSAETSAAPGSSQASDPGAAGQPSDSPQSPQTAESASESAGSASAAESYGDWLKTKTGKFYGRFSDGKMTMKYQMEYEGIVMTVLTATDGTRSYSENSMDGQTVSASLIDGETLYSIDHGSRTIVKTALQRNAQQTANSVLTEEDVDPAAVKTGTRVIDGKTYDTEEWTLDGGKTTFCFDGGELAYMISEADGEEYVIKILEISGKVDESLFTLPAGYEIISY